ncbi:CocE/NonD family hydrolase [Marinobacter salinisoli]|uniref:CocE/NonD family hydrolase n=1 Tax=Marinobacter salinisoli TaxID=2769486 RepID=A0ABX7MQY8_9GAMM|nr:CocE/NonD family hydrolase [Marinobacter salinisoli]QSP94746.1 CocE/NonD family hydrolase [Marinobacter salinisoli]
MQKNIFITNFKFLAIFLILLCSACASTSPEAESANYAEPGDNPVQIQTVDTLVDKVIIERDIPIYTRDGVRLSARIYRPNKIGQFPVIMSFTAYGKDLGPTKYPKVLEHNAKPDFDLGPINVSPWTTWEAPDPAFWVPEDYVVIYVDSRGYFGSQGKAAILSERDGNDFYDAIEWAGTQTWSNGHVGLNGVSYLAISQWVAASARPPHLKAIIPWEGQTDAYREVLYHGGIPETAFTDFWINKVNTGAKSRVGPPGFLFSFLHQRPWLFKRVVDPINIELSKIDVPALIAATWSDQGLHSRGSFQGYKSISSDEKWLFTHGRPKWSTYYSEEALEFQKKFFDHFLKGEPTGITDLKPVRLEVRETLTKYKVRYEDDWPIPRTEYRALFLDQEKQSLTHDRPRQETTANYDAKSGTVTYQIQFDEDTELSGNMKLKLWVSTSRGSDMDLFIGVNKLDINGDKVDFYGKTGFNKGVVALGWLRVSERKLDEQTSEPWLPVLTHRDTDKISPDQIVPVNIEILPSSTLFRKGESLELTIQGHDIFDHPMLAHDRTVNKGIHSVHTGGVYDSHLLIPVIPN